MDYTETAQGEITTILTIYSRLRPRVKMKSRGQALFCGLVKRSSRVGGKRGSTDSDCGGGSHDTITCNLTVGAARKKKKKQSKFSITTLLVTIRLKTLPNKA